MKKLTSFFTSALVLAASATPIVGHAEFNVDSSRYWSGEKAMFAAMDSGELETDIDGNGIVDALDGYLLNVYTFSATSLGFNIPDEVNSRIEAIADYNGDGVVDDDDTTSWVRHFIVNGGLNADIFEDDYYVSEYISPDSEYYIYSKMLFKSELYRNMEALRAGYYVVSDMYKKGIIDLDVNGNGQLDIGDAYSFYAYNDSNDKAQYYDDCDDVFRTYCSAVSKSPSAYVIVSKDNFIYYTSLCIVENIELKSEYFTGKYYKETFGESTYFSETIAHKIEQAAAALGLKADDDAWIKFDKDEMNDFFKSYCNDVENGVRPAPDVNMDGVVDYYDYFDTNIYFGDLLNDRTADDSILPADIWNNLAENCDFDGNGTSRDICDILTVQLYVVKYAEIDNFDEAYKEYTESLGRVSPASVEGFSYEDNVKILASLETENVVYGDANEDGDVDIADTTAIIQSIGNPDKYALSRQGEINADCYNTGDGVTGMDALTIQRFSVNMIYALPYNE